MLPAKASLTQSLVIAVATSTRIQLRGIIRTTNASSQESTWNSLVVIVAIERALTARVRSLRQEESDQPVQTCKTPVLNGLPSSNRIATARAVRSVDRVDSGEMMASTHRRAAA